MLTHDRLTGRYCAGPVTPAGGLRLFCFPYAGGSARMFRAWQAALPPRVEVWPVELPGHGRRVSEAFETQLSALVDGIAREIAAGIDRPFAFFGHSMGALIAFELTRHLRRRHGVEPATLVLSAHVPNDSRTPRPRTFDLPELAFVEELRRLQGTDDDLLSDPELLEVVLPILRADFRVCQTHTSEPDAPLDCPLVVFGGLDDPEAPAEMLQRWKTQTTGDTRVHVFRGGHFFVHHEEGAVLQVLHRVLAPLVRTCNGGHS
jgi:medium-chain acyl-[acyl-carrier-protein] hydrolase